MSSLHLLTIFCLNKTDDADASWQEVSGRQCNRCKESKNFQAFMLTIYKKVIIRHVLPRWNRCTSIIAQMEDPGFDTQPIAESDKAQL
jgi:hypothetical protein